MALKLEDSFQINCSILQLNTALKNTKFHEERYKKDNLEKITITNTTYSTFEITSLFNFDIPASAQALISNPVTITESWEITPNHEIKVQINIAKAQTKIAVNFLIIEAEQMLNIEIKSKIESRIFLMASYVEEFVAKYWKQKVKDDLQALSTWIESNQT
jgi:predicted secreted protein